MKRNKFSRLLVALILLAVVLPLAAGCSGYSRIAPGDGTIKETDALLKTVHEGSPSIIVDVNGENLTLKTYHQTEITINGENVSLAMLAGHRGEEVHVVYDATVLTALSIVVVN